ncbi:hypothetical protein CIY_31040 [Butyrivibrio fibrisolvens 16/4]|nr:hypothetical protein CIY_31040 [Butyrivibrio fibrisolvens 16/4]
MCVANDVKNWYFGHYKKLCKILAQFTQKADFQSIDLLWKNAEFSLTSMI